MVRIKHRYILATFVYPSAKAAGSDGELPDVLQFNQPSPDALTAQLLLRIVRDGVAELFGDYGAGQVAPYLKVNYLSTATSTAIIRAPRAYFRLVWAALTFVTRLPKPINKECVIRVVRVSGTIRKAEDEVIRRAKQMILRARSAEGGEVDEILKNMNGAVAVGAAGGYSESFRGIEDDDDGDEEDVDDDDMVVDG